MKTRHTDIGIGDLVKSRINGFEGIVTCESYWLNGCVRLLVEPNKMKEDGTTLPGASFDIQELELVKADVVTPRIPQKGTTAHATTGGGDRPEPEQLPDAKR